MTENHTLMQVIDDKLSATSLADTLIVMLPGAYDKPQQFVEHGFVAAMRERSIAADIKLVDAHTEYYLRGEIIQRLEAEIITPARGAGYQHIWFLGISLGGYGSLLYSQQALVPLTGIVLLAPFMGPRDIPAAVTAQGGLKAWNGAADSAEAIDLKLWHWLQAHVSQPLSPPLIYLGFGKDDRFVQPNTLLAAHLPSTQLCTIAGAHDWQTWQKIWVHFLDTIAMPRLKSAQASLTLKAVR